MGSKEPAGEKQGVVLDPCLQGLSVCRKEMV